MLKWKPQYVVLDHITQFEVDKNSIIIKFTKSQVMMTHENVKLLITSRNEKNRFQEFTINNNGSNEIVSVIPFNSEILRDLNSNEIFDFYLIADNKKIRVKTKKTDFPIASYNGYKEVLQIFKGEQDNLSFRKIKYKEIIRLDDVRLEDDFKMYADAKISLPSIDSKEDFDYINLFFVTESRTLSLMKKERIDKSLLKFNVNERAVEFKFEKKVEDEFLQKDFRAYFLIETNKRVIRPDIYIYGDLVGFNRYVKGRIYTFTINEISKERNLNELLFITNKRLFIPMVKTVLLDKNRKIFDITLSLLNNNLSIIEEKKKEAHIVIKKRNTLEPLKIPIVSFTQEEIRFKLDFSTISNEEVLTAGTWDFYLNYNEFDYRISYDVLANYNANKVVSYPMASFERKKEQLSSKIYVTGDGQLSLYIRSRLIHNNFEYIYSKRDIFKFKAKMKIFTPLEFIEAIKYGTLKIKGIDGNIKSISGNLQISKVENTSIMYEYSFEAAVDKNDLFFKQNLFNDNWLLEFSTEDQEFICSIPPNKDKFYTSNNLLRRYLPDHILKKINESLYKNMNKLIPVSKKHYIFQSHHGKQYSCNPRAIYEELNRVRPNNRYIWVMKNDRVEIPGNPTIVKPYTLKYFYYLARSKYLINNGNFLDHFQKKKGTVFLQTWHGTPLKRLGFDLDSTTSNYHFHTSKALVKRNSNWDVLLSPNNHTTNALKSAFRFKKEIAEFGYPRNDVLVNNEDNVMKERLKEKYNIPKNKKVLLYSPTWRDKENINEPFELGFNIETFQRMFSEDHVLLLRLHPIDTLRFHSLVDEKNVINVSFVDEINELYIVSDMMITDYSSTMFDYANTKKPVILYMHDYAQYVNSLRGIYFDIKEISPGINAYNQDQLFKAIRSAKNNSKKFEWFYKEFCLLEEGNAAKKVVEKYLL